MKGRTDRAQGIYSAAVKTIYNQSSIYSNQL